MIEKKHPEQGVPGDQWKTYSVFAEISGIASFGFGSPTHAADGFVLGGGLAILAFDADFHAVEAGFQAGGAVVAFLTIRDGIGEGLGQGGDGLIQFGERGDLGGELCDADFGIGRGVADEGFQAGDVAFHVGSDFRMAELPAVAGFFVCGGVHYFGARHPVRWRLWRGFSDTRGWRC